MQPPLWSSTLFALDSASCRLWLRVLEPLLCPEALGLACYFSVSLGGDVGSPWGDSEMIQQAKKKKNKTLLTLAWERMDLSFLS